MLVSIQNANYIGEYKIKLLFNDGIEKTIDFSSFLKNAKNPMTKKYLDQKLFESFTIEYGDIR